MSVCPTGCGRNVALGNLLCRPCWHMVPSPLAAEVWRAWRQLNNAVAKGMGPRAIATLKREHAEAKEKAIEYARGRVVQPELFG